MNHQAVIQSESERPYGNRQYILGRVDRSTFDALNQGGHVLALNGYCLDAIDELPAGCMRKCIGRPGQHYVIRGVSLKEQEDREALAQQLIDEILKEERS